MSWKGEFRFYLNDQGTGIGPNDTVSMRDTTRIKVSVVRMGYTGETEATGDIIAEEGH